MMETVTTMILSALAAGAAASGKDIASQAVQDAYQGLKALVQRKFSDQPKASAVLEEYEKDPETWEKPLEKKLTEAGADRDSQIFQAAEITARAAAYGLSAETPVDEMNREENLQNYTVHTTGGRAAKDWRKRSGTWRPPRPSLGRAWPCPVPVQTVGRRCFAARLDGPRRCLS